MNKITFAIVIIVASAFLPSIAAPPAAPPAHVAAVTLPDEAILKPGDMVIYKAPVGTFLPDYIYDYPAIYIGDNSVVEFTEGTPARVVITRLSEFKKRSADGKLHIVDMKKTFPGSYVSHTDTIIRCAKQHYYYSNGETFGDYHPLFHNDQHFVTNCALANNIVSWQADNISSVAEHKRRITPDRNLSREDFQHFIEYAQKFGVY